MARLATRRQEQLLVFIRSFQLAHGYSPSFREMGRAIGVRGMARITDMLDELEERGLLRRLYMRSRAVEVLVEIAIPRAPDGAPLFAVPGFGDA